MLRADAARTRAVGLSCTGSQIMLRDKGFDVDARCARALMDGDQRLEWNTESTQRRSPACARARIREKERKR